MTNGKNFDVIIIGGSYAGLSAAMALGRSLRKVLILDSGKPCNSQTPHSHNFLTQDGETPPEISARARAQVLQYPTVEFFNGLAEEGFVIEGGYAIRTRNDDIFTAKKLLFATGLIDQMPDIKEFAQCWGISVLHCPYCHGYEVKDQAIGLLGNRDIGYEVCRLISNWTKRLTLFTNGGSALTIEQTQKIKSHHIDIVEKEIAAFEHKKSYIQEVIFKDGTQRSVSALFARVAFKQHCDIPQNLGCEITEQGFIKTDDFHRTSLYGVYAAGDNTTMFRAVSIAVAAGTRAGAFLNKELIDESF